MENQSSKSDIGLYFGLLTAVICLFQLALFMPSLKLFFQTGSLTRNATDIPWVVIPPILLTGLVQIGLWVGLSTLIWVLAKLNLKRITLPQDKHLMFAIALWLVAVIAVFCANQVFFPRSLFSDFSRTLLPNSLAYILLLLCLLMLLVSTVIAIMALCQHALYYCLAGLTVGLAVFIFSLNLKQTHPVTSPQAQPNIFIIGIDSLRPDHVGLYGGQYAFTPNLDAFLKSATHFTNATTPLARTYPSWISILTGRFPKEDGARYDLIERSKVNLSHNLAETLQKRGYKTIYASDERRFSNIDSHYHFDKIIAPALGFNDFLLGTFNDFPLGNLIINTRLGGFLFPYNHMNRAANISYYPGSFNRAVFRSLKSTSERPVFMALHLCLSHFPYVWAASAPQTARNFSDLKRLYHLSLLAVDLQFKHMIQFLKQHDFLKNAIVVVVSDHGEALKLAGDRPLTKEKYLRSDNQTSSFMEWLSKTPGSALNQSKGHGTDVLSRSQYHIVFAVRQFGKHQNTPKRFSFPVSLIDIKPTLFDLLKIDDKQSSGISLAPYLKHEAAAPPKTRPLFFETGFSPDIMLSKKMTMQNLLDLGVRYYKIDPKTGVLSFRQDMTPLIIANKQRAVGYGPWLLALYPNGIRVLVNHETGQWTDDLNSQLALKSPLTTMQAALKKQYGDEIK